MNEIGNDQTIYIVNRRKCVKGDVHSFYARNDVVEELQENQVEYETNFDWKNIKHRKAFHKAGLNLEQFEDSVDCAQMHLSLIFCKDCKEIIAIVTHCY